MSLKETETTETPLVQQKFIQNMLNALPGAIVVLDQNCKIVNVNNEWIEFGIQKEISEPTGWYGANYFDVAYLTTLQSDGERKQFRTRIKEILTGQSDRFEKDYYHNHGKEKMRFRIHANRFDFAEESWATISQQNITERKKHESELLHNTLDALMQPLNIIDVRDHTVKFTNSAGKKHDLGGGTTCHKLNHDSDTPCDLRGHSCPMKEMKQTGKPVRVERMHTGTNGEKQYFEVHGYPIFDDDGILVQMIEFSIDITDRKLVEEELRKSEEKFRGVFNSITDVFSRSDMEGNCIMISPSVFEVTGYSTEEVIGRKFSEFYVNPEHRNILSQKLQESGSVNHYEAEIIRKDGSSFTGSANSKIIYNDAGHPIGIESIFRDVTAIKKVEEALQASETNLVKAQEVGHIGSWSLDLLENILVWTDENYRIFGIPKGTPMNYERFLENVHPEDRDYVHKKWSAAIKGEPYDIQHRLLIDNEVRWVREKAEMIFDSKRNPISGIGITQDITERKLFEKELEENEDKFRFIFENALVGIGISNSSGEVLLANNTMCKIIGSTPEEISDFRLPESFVDPSERMKILRRLKKDGFVENYEVQLYNSSKEMFWAHLSTVQIKQANKERVLTSIIDISEGKRVEKALLESEEKFRTLVTNIEEIIYAIDKDGIFLLSEGRGLSRLDLTPGEVVGKSVFDLYKGYPAMLSNIRQALNGKTVSFESYVGKNYFRNWYTPHKNQEGEIIGLLGLSINTTEQKNAERLLEKSHRQLQKAEKTALMGSIDWNLKTNKVIWSKELYNLYGVEQGIPITIEKTLSLVHPDDLEFVNKNREMAIQGDKIYNIDYRIIRPDNKVIWVSARADLEYDKMGKPITFLGIVIDITERKKAEQKILKYKDHLKELATELTITEERLRKQIATDLHDDVGQLLASARMQLGTINNEMDKYEVPKKIESISQSLSKAIQFTRDAIFSLSPPQLSEIGLYAAIHDWMKEQIEIKYGINTLITGDNKKFHLEENTRLLLFRSIRELLMNVVKHARAKHLNVNISTQKGILEVRIQDDGIGFDSKSDLTRLKSKGYGLFSIQERMADLGGYMKIESNPEKGTEIKLVLPYNENLS